MQINIRPAPASPHNHRVIKRPSIAHPKLPMHRPRLPHYP